MKCSGEYVFKKQKFGCEKKWSCNYYSFRTRAKRDTPTSRDEECEHYLEVTYTKVTKI